MWDEAPPVYDVWVQRRTHSPLRMARGMWRRPGNRLIGRPFDRPAVVPGVAMPGGGLQAQPAYGAPDAKGIEVVNVHAGVLDYDATTLDDLHYVMTKTLAFRRSIGLQLHDTALDCHGEENHGRLDELFELMAMYHALAEDDIAYDLLPAPARATLADADVEAELHRVHSVLFNPFAYTYQFVPEQSTRHYLAWDPTGGPANVTVDNPYGAQRGIAIELRPRFQFLFSPGFQPPLDGVDARLLWEPAPLPLSDLDLAVVGGDGDCTWDGATLTIEPATADGPVVCRIDALQFLGLEDIDLAYQRGFAVNASADTNGVVLYLHLARDHGYRDYRYPLPVAPQASQWVVLADPIVDPTDEYLPPGQSETRDLPLGYGNKAERAWDFHFGDVRTLELLVAVEPTAEPVIHVDIEGLYALDEQVPATLENPVIEVVDTGGSTTRTFDDDPTTAAPDDLTLSLAGGRAPAILRYRGWDGGQDGAYELRTQYESAYDTTVSPAEPFMTVWMHAVAPGPVEIRVDSARAPGPWTRAELVVTFFDDEDMDGMPTHCLWEPDPAQGIGACPICDLQSDFCRDDNPLMPFWEQQPF